MPTAIAMSTGSIRLNQAPQFSTIPHLTLNFEISQTKKSTEQPKTVHSEPEQPKAMRAALNNLDQPRSAQNDQNSPEQLNSTGTPKKFSGIA